MGGLAIPGREDVFLDITSQLDSLLLLVFTYMSASYERSWNNSVFIDV